MNPIGCAVLLACLSLVAAPRAQQPPGYDGTFPSEAAQQALRDAMKTPWEDTKKVAGGGTWQLVDGGVTPHALGPCRGDVIEISTAETKGPHLRLVRDHLAICLPTTTDGDVAATLHWLGRAVPAGLSGEPTASWKLAAARTEALGEPVAGLRAAVLPRTRKPTDVQGLPTSPTAVEVLLWQVEPAQRAVGLAQLRVDGVPLPVALTWPRPIRKCLLVAYSSVALPAGGTVRHPTDLDALLAIAGKPRLAAGKHEVELVFEIDGGAGAAVVLHSRKLTIEISAPAGPRAK